MGEGLGWLLVVNLVLWSGLFLYLLRLGRRLRIAERTPADAAAAPDAAASAARSGPER